MRLLRAATLSVADLERSVDAYAATFDYRIVERGRVDAGLARSLDAPAAVDAPMAVLGPASGASVFIRLVQVPAHPAYLALRTLGWAAIELCVTDVQAALARVADSPFQVIGPPRPLDGFPDIVPMQVRGPDAEIVYLTQIDASPPGMRLPQARSLVDQPFILVLAASDLEAARQFAASTLGLVAGPAAPIRYTMINQAFSLPEDTRHAIATVGHGEDVFLEFDQYPHGVMARPRHTGQPVPGISSVSLMLPGLEARLAELGPLMRGPARRIDDAISQGALAVTVEGPDGTAFDLMEMRP
jgi:catechol 2,3-dioxygenase-like lactoylglutathione lyase family enzyme